MNLKALREAHGMSQLDLAERVGVRGSTISQYESGKRHPNVRMLKKLAEVLDCTVDELLA